MKECVTAYQASAEHEPLSTVVVFALARVNGVEPESVPPLYHSIEPDALDMLFQQARSHPDHVEFEHDNCTITVDSGDTVSVTIEPIE